jgi:hypothetical protein
VSARAALVAAFVVGAGSRFTAGCSPPTCEQPVPVPLTYEIVEASDPAWLGGTVEVLESSTLRADDWSAVFRPATGGAVVFVAAEGPVDD